MKSECNNMHGERIKIANADVSVKPIQFLFCQTRTDYKSGAKM